MNRQRFTLKFCRRRWVISLLVLLGFVVTLVIPMLSVRPTELSSRAIVSVAQAQALLQQGIERYEAARFSEAVAFWQQAASAFSGQNQTLGQALALSHLSLAYQQLGQLDAAERASVSSLTWLKTLDAAASPRVYSEVLGKALNARGRLHWTRGQLEPALEAWQQAARAYADAGYERGVAIAKINQARALQELGLSVQAAEALQRLYQRLKRQPDSDLKALGLQQLGHALRRVGHLERSRQVLRESVAVAAGPTIQSAALLELGNSERAARDRAIAIGQTTIARQHEQAALDAYQSAAHLSDPATLLQVQAQANRLSLLIDSGQRSVAVTLWPDLQASISDLPISRASIYAQLNLARSLTCLQQNSLPTPLNCTNPTRRSPPSNPPVSPGTPPLPTIAQLLNTAAQQARNLKDPVAESYALGQMGELYELSGQRSQALPLTQQALFLAAAAQAPDIRYRWEWQLGRLQEQQGEIENAIASYGRAVATLEQVRGNLRPIAPDVQFSFRDTVEPVYRAFVNLLLRPANNAPPSQANLRQAIQQLDALQLAELENFLGCDLSQSLKIVEEIVDPTAATLYPIVLPDRLAVIFEIPGQPLGYHETPVSQTEIETTLRTLRHHLTKRGDTPEVIASAQKVYDWLIAPLEPVLTQNRQIETLTFVLDGALRNIPMGVLYAKKQGQYLIEKPYAIAIAPRLKLFRPAPSPPKLNLFTGGVDIPQTIEGKKFPAIEYLTEELKGVAQITTAAPPLLNEDFTKTNIEQQLQTGRFSAIHWKTHGVFSSDPEKTYIVTYQDSLKARDLNQLLQTSRHRRAEPLELLVLSACETARGDNRAILGLAGIAVRTGARSALSTLWRADDRATTELMTRFYQEWSRPGTTKAQALHRAQQGLLKEAGYPAPHIWATYILVGNWL